MEKVIAHCSSCPLSRLYGAPAEPACVADIYLPEVKGYARYFDVRDETGMTIFPGPPPDWCPLRGEPLTMTVP